MLFSLFPSPSLCPVFFSLWEPQRDFVSSRAVFATSQSHSSVPFTLGGVTGFFFFFVPMIAKRSPRCSPTPSSIPPFFLYFPPRLNNLSFPPPDYFPVSLHFHGFPPTSRLCRASPVCWGGVGQTPTSPSPFVYSGVALCNLIELFEHVSRYKRATPHVFHFPSSFNPEEIPCLQHSLSWTLLKSGGPQHLC